MHRLPAHGPVAVGTGFGDAWALSLILERAHSPMHITPTRTPLPTSKNSMLPIKGSNSVSELADSRGMFPCGLG